MEIVLLIVLGLAAGTLGAMLGLGGGFLVVPALILLRDFDTRIATATSIAVIVPAMLMALWRRGVVDQQVDWRVAGLVAIGAVAGAWLGSELVKRMDPTWLRRMFAGVLVVLAALLVFRK